MDYCRTTTDAKFRLNKIKIYAYAYSIYFYVILEMRILDIDLPHFLEFKHKYLLLFVAKLCRTTITRRLRQVCLLIMCSARRTNNAKLSLESAGKETIARLRTEGPFCKRS